MGQQSTRRVLHDADRLSPSSYGAYLSALVLFFEITQLRPEWLLVEFNPDDRHHHHESAANALGISPDIAWKLAFVANQTVQLGYPIQRGDHR